MKSNRRVSLGLATFALTMATSFAAHADGIADAWTAAKGSLPADPAVIFGVNIATIKSSQIFQQLYPTLMKQGHATEGLEMVKKACGIDVTDAVLGAVVVMETMESKPVLYVATKGFDEGKVVDCLTKVASKDKKQVITASKADAMGVVELSASGEKDHMYLGFKPNHVIVVATSNPSDKATLVKALGGHGIGAGSAASGPLGHVNTSAAVWGVVVKAQQLDAGANMKVAYGAADIKGGNITADIHLVLASDKEASASATKANHELEEAKKNGKVPPQLTNVVKSVKITSSGAEMSVTASMAEKEALGLIGMALGGGM